MSCAGHEVKINNYDMLRFVNCETLLLRAKISKILKTAGSSTQFSNSFVSHWVSGCKEFFEIKGPHCQKRFKHPVIGGQCVSVGPLGCNAVRTCMQMSA